MIKQCMLVAALAAIPVVSFAADAAPPQQKSTASNTPQISQERLARIRPHLVAPIAAYGPAEGAMRTPTTHEAASLAIPPGSGTATVKRLAGGGVAMQGDVSNA